MRRLMRSALLAAAILAAAGLGTGCGLSPGGAAASAPARGAVLARASAQPSVTPTAVTPSVIPTTPSPSVVPTTPSPSVAPSTATTPASPSPSSSPTSSSGSAASLLWLWVVLGAAVLLGIILLATRSPAVRPRPAAVASRWHARAADAYAKGAALDGAVRAAEREGTLAEPSGTRWADLQRRVDDLSETLYTLRESAPTEPRRVQADDAIAALLALRSSMDSLRAPERARMQEAGALYHRLSALESALNALRVPVPENPYP
jgi:hypothetical protein